MKKSVYVIACMICGILIVVMALTLILPPLRCIQAEKKIVGTWRLDALEGPGSQYAIFDESGAVHLRTEITMADNQVISQDYSGIGLMTYEILDSHTIQFSTTVMGATTKETVSYQFQGNDTLILEGNTYIRYVDVPSDK